MFGKKKILLVEDELFIRELYERALSQAGYEVIIAIDGEQALKVAKKDLDLILLDIMLPKIHGIDVLKQLKKSDETKDIPVVMITNLGQEDVINDAFKIGAQGYLIKMRLTPYEIINKVGEFLSNPNYKMNPTGISYD